MRQRKPISAYLSLVAPFALILTSCGTSESPVLPKSQAEDSRTASDGTSDQTLEQRSGRSQQPPKDYYDAVLQEEFALLRSDEGLSATASPTLFVNFDGASVDQGYGAGESFLVCEDSSVPSADLSISDQKEIISIVRDLFKNAKIGINLTTNPPPVSRYTTIHVGGLVADLGCDRYRDTGGIAPIDSENFNFNDIAFVFSDYLKGNNNIAVAIAHQFGHTVGLEDVSEDGYVMSTNLTEGAEFGTAETVGSQKPQDAASLMKNNLNQGTSSAFALTGANSGDLPNLTAVPVGLLDNGLLKIIASLGSLLLDFDAQGSLDISKLFPQIDKILPGGIDILGIIGGLGGLEDIIAVVQLAAEAAAKDAGTTVEASGIGAILKLFLDPSSLQANDLLSIAGLAAEIGLAAITGGASGALTAALDLLFSGIFGGDTAGQNPSSSTAFTLTQPTNLPNFAELFSLDQASSLPDLITQTRLLGSLVNTNYDGDARDALISAVIVGSSQAYQDMGL